MQVLTNNYTNIESIKITSNKTKNNTFNNRDSLKSKYKVFTKMPKVLLVEDTPTIQFVNIKFLEILGCHVELAKDGLEAIEMFKNNYDLVLLDVGLPGISGIEAAARMRQLESVKRIPIIAITAYGDLVASECLQAGVNETFVKPVLLERLSEILKYWLKEFL